MKNILTAILLLLSLASSSQDTTNTKEIHATIKAMTKKRFFASRETSNDTLISYCYHFKNKEFFRAICQSRKENGRIDNTALFFDFYFCKGKVIMINVGKWKERVFSAYYFNDNQLFKSNQSSKIPSFSEAQLLDKANSLLRKQQEYLQKSKFSS